MGRRASGAALLLAAAVTILVASKLSNPPALQGHPAVEPPALPPTTQTCIAEVGTDLPFLASGQLAVRNHAYVPCDAPHQGEVFYVYDRLLSLAVGRTSQGELCVEPGADSGSYLGLNRNSSPGGWQPVLTYATTIIGPDARQLAAGQLWSACVLTYGSTGEILPQTVRGVVQGGKVPAELSSCTAGGATVVRAPASCAAKHSVEVLAENDDQTATVQSLSRSCQELAARETGRASIADTAGLTVEVTIVVLTIDGPRLAPAVPSDLPSTTWCAIRADNGRSLTDSLRGVGDAAIPWAN